MEKRVKKEINNLKKILRQYEVSETKIKFLLPVIENTAWMKLKLDDSRAVIRESNIAISYDNGGGQTGIRENPLFKGYESLWKSYMSGMNVILNTLPEEVAKVETEKAVEVRTMLDIVREKHKKET